ncbi:prolyl oligopeptidase family serine peptidase [Paenibacillus sp. S150]|nr:prolyl oligopeptidase family serine peptidase [Paenibacillus sp. S150]
MTGEIENYMLRRLNGAPRSLAFHSGGDFAAWRQALSGRFLQRLGGFPPVRASLAPVLLERTERPDYIRERLEITTYEGLRMPVYLMIPKQPLSFPAPAVVAVHGHGYGSREIVGLTPDGAERTDTPGLHKDFAVSLVRRGFVVAAPEMFGFGDRRLIEDKLAGEPGRNSCFRLSAQLLMTGETMAGFRVYETLRVLDYLQSRTDAAPERTGIMGISGGGLVAGFAAALDERFRCAVVSGYTSTFAASILSRSHCLDNYIPGLLNDAEMPDLLGLIAPRGLFLEVGDKDHLFPPEAARGAYARLQEIYAAAARSHPAGVSAVTADLFDGGHEIHGGPAFAWLREQLG